MNRSADKNHTKRRWPAAILAISLLWIITIRYSTAKFESPPVRTSALDTQSAAADSAFAPFLNIVPLQDGTGLFIKASEVGQEVGAIFTNIGVGPGCYKGSYTMPYSDTEQAYVAIATGFTPGINAYAPLNITTTLGLDSGAVDFNRAYVPASTMQSIGSIDGNLELTLAATDIITFDTYIAVVPSYAPPGPLPKGHTLVGSAYSVRAAGALVETGKNMSLHLYYSDTTLAGADPHTLAIFAWDAYNKQWEDLGGTLFYTQRYVSVATSRFTTYALVATPSWRDGFYDFDGLDFPGETHNVTLGVDGDNRTLILAGAALSGVAVSKPITPTTRFAHWGTLAYSYTVDPPTTTLTVDVLMLDGTPVLTDVASGIDLSSLDAAGYPALKLRANLASTTVGETPALDAWTLSWQVKTYGVYLPIVLNEE